MSLSKNEKEEIIESFLSPNDEQHAAVMEDGNHDDVNDDDKDDKEDSKQSFVEEYSIIQPPPPPQPTQKEIHKAEKELKKKRAVFRDKPQVQATTEPPALPTTNTNLQPIQHNNDFLLELQPDSELHPSHQQETDSNSMNGLSSKQITISQLEEQPVARHELSAQDQEEHDKANNANNNNGAGVNTYTDLEPGATNPNENNQQPQGSQEPLAIVDDAFRVLTAEEQEEQRRQRLEQEHQNLPLFEGQLVPSSRPSLTPSQQEAKEIKTENHRLIILFVVCAIVLVIVLVPSLVLTNRSNNNGNNFKLATSSLLPSSNPSASPVPSFSPSISIFPSSFPTTTLPTSTSFDDVVALLGLDKDSLSMYPNDYVFRAVQWMVEQDQATRAVLLRQQEAGTELKKQDPSLVQRFALVCLYFATKGDSSWIDTLGFLNPFTSECGWRVFGRLQGLAGGATINCVDDVVTGIALSDNNLGGMIPSQIGLLTQLTWLELERNEIGGTLPSLSQLSQLRILRLQLNDLTGPIPEAIGDLTNLVVLDLWSNFITGSIPSSIQSMSMLNTLSLPFNMLTSTLPTEINNLDQLKIYLVIANLFTGTLPFETGSNPLLEWFVCESNDLSGDLSGLVHLSRLMSLAFSLNKFTGTIPIELCNFSLQSINGGFNRLTGSLPDCLSDLTLLTSLILGTNSLIGSIPILPTSLETLILWENQLTGQIPTGPFPNLIGLNLFSNNFTAGSIPTELATWTNLEILILHSCQLTGTIHTEIGQLTQLTTLALFNNRLSGTIPTEVGLLQNLEALELSVNSLTGTIPSEIGMLRSLRTLALGANLLTGPLPSTFANFPVETLGELYLQGNVNLTGDVGFFCQNDRTFGVFLANCLGLTNCTCCTGCCDIRNIIDNDQCVDFFNNLL